MNIITSSTVLQKHKPRVKTLHIKEGNMDTKNKEGYISHENESFWLLLTKRQHKTTDIYMRLPYINVIFYQSLLIVLYAKHILNLQVL